MGVLETVANILGRLPPAAVQGFWDMLKAILSGDATKAERLARNTANAVAAKEIVKRRFAKG
jgi:hypothetical protein